jgi:glycosyltransferase involved in cell wall biosynthesis
MNIGSVPAAPAEKAADAPPTLNRRVVVVMPAYNAERTLERTYSELPHDRIDDVILVDDGSRDGTVSLARKLGLRVFVHRRNFGYGANQKTCYTEALRSGAAIIAMVHPDYQYDPRILPDLLHPIEIGEADVVFGSRMKGQSALKQGMPWWKYVSNRALTWLENRVFSLSLSEFHTGYRVYSRRALEHVNFQSNADGFIFDQEIVAQFVECGLRIAEVSVPVRYFPEASSASLRASLGYGLGILLLLGRFVLHRASFSPSRQFDCLQGRYVSAG